MIKENSIKVEDEDMKAVGREVAAAQLQQYGLYGLSDEQLDGFAVRLLDDQTIPSDIRLKEPLNLPEPMTEREFAEHISELASKNEVFTSYIGMGWYLFY